MTKKRTNRAERKRQATASLHLTLQPISPLTENQKIVLNNPSSNQVLSGCAGTGKTFLSSYLAYKALTTGEFAKIIYVRSAVSTRDIGFLPGTEAEKMAVYELPYKEITNELFDRAGTYDDLKKKGTLEFLTTSFIRGTTLKDSVVIVDEIQNMTFHELDSVITRYGQNCRYYFCGDFRQSDLKSNKERLGILDFLNILKMMENDFVYTEFTEDDIVRSDLVRRYIIARNKYESSPK